MGEMCRHFTMLAKEIPTVIFLNLIPLAYASGFDRRLSFLPWQDLSQVTDAKLYNAIPPLATGLPHLYYSLTTLQNNHICPNMTKITAASITETAASIILQFLYL